MSFDGEQQAFFVHTAAVVLYAQQRFSAVSYGDANFGGLCVERVFNELLDGGGGSFQNFTRSDAVDDFLRKAADDGLGLRYGLGSRIVDRIGRLDFSGGFCGAPCALRVLLCCCLRHGFCNEFRDQFVRGD